MPYIQIIAADKMDSGFVNANLNGCVYYIHDAFH